ncbi:YraN family protein [Acidipila sp. EB88]|uniref:YraN family protein n=1 Tax=Acidipila sp. EB88 TaxID=2305226 RepID=UPI000F5EF1CD|nr:YraN family protein [Acidipila sp. EB88]RRA49971.1 hypothetical protein D1Y84_05555 [Acidipila sp. EB88]
MPVIAENVRAAAWERCFRALDRWPWRRASGLPEHLETGRRGEEAGFFYLRRLGMTVVAHGWQSGRAPGDLDLVAWEQDTLCIVEVKTRTSREVATAESAVDFGKRRTLRRLTRHYLRQLPEGTVARFDVLSIYFTRSGDARGASFELFRNAFGWDEGERLL